MLTVRSGAALKEDGPLASPYPTQVGQSFLERAPHLLPYIVYVYNLAERRTEYQNRQLGAELGYSDLEFSAMEGRVIETLAHPEDVERLSELLERWRTAQDGEVIETEYRMRHRNGQWRWFLARDSVLERDASGQVVRFIGTTLDITERKRLEAQLRQAQKLEAVGRLAGGIAHDFNNILTAILGHVELASLDPTDLATVNECLEQVRTASTQAAGLTRQLLAFAREQVLRPEIFDPSQQVRECMQLLRRIIGEDIDVALELAADAYPVRVDRAQFVQIVMNLVVNAKDALPGGGRVTLRTRRAEVEGNVALDRRAGEYSVLEVEDNGTGMTAEVRAHVFEPFFTTKPSGKGTGLGLATVHGIIHQVGGFIEVDSEVGRGTRFTLYFPRAESVAEPVVEATVRPLKPATMTAILLVEDDPLVGAVERSVLERAGHVLVTVRNAEQAEAELGARGDAFVELLITDVVLPGVSGLELASRLRERNPDLKVLYTSGYPRLPEQAGELERPGVEFLAKPFSPAELLARVERLLEG
jgi:two-component system cell cycle sensor histidine kinase/response regulator CckA